MSRLSVFFVILCFSFSVLADRKLEGEFLVSCRKNSDCNETLDSWGGQLQYPDQNVKKLICDNKDRIVQTTNDILAYPAFQWVQDNFSFYQKPENDFYLKPETLASCLMAEHMILYGFRDGLVDGSLVDDPTGESLVTAAKTFFSSDFTHDTINKVSVGPAQIHVRTARTYAVLKNQPENWINKDWKVKDGVSLPTIEQVIPELVGVEAFDFAAILLGDALRAYSRFANPDNGGFPEFDIRERTDLQCTLYNIGGANDKASRRWQKMKQAKAATGDYTSELPGPNYYGLYAQLVEELAVDLIHGDGCE